MTLKKSLKLNLGLMGGKVNPVDDGQNQGDYLHEGGLTEGQQLENKLK